MNKYILQLNFSMIIIYHFIYSHMRTKQNNKYLSTENNVIKKIIDNTSQEN